MGGGVRGFSEIETPNRKKLRHLPERHLTRGKAKCLFEIGAQQLKHSELGGEERPNALGGEGQVRE